VGGGGGGGEEKFYAEGGGGGGGGAGGRPPPPPPQRGGLGVWGGGGGGKGSKKIFVHDIQFSGRDSNRVLPECRSDALAYSQSPRYLFYPTERPQLISL